MAAQEQAVRTNLMKAKIDKTQEDWSLCKEHKRYLEIRMASYRGEERFQSS